MDDSPSASHIEKTQTHTDGAFALFTSFLQHLVPISSVLQGIMLALVSLVLFANVANSFVVRMPAMHQTTSLQQQRRHMGHQLSMISAPHGGKLVNTMVKEVSKQNELISSCDMEVDLDERQICDVELLMQGGFSPLEGYMEEADYKSVVNEHRLKNGILFGLPVVFDTNDESIVPGKRLLLKYQRIPIAVMDVSSKYLPNKADEAKKCYGTSSIEHPAVMMITTERGKYYCGGKITGLNRPIREFPCKSPEEVRAGLPTDVDVVAFQCRNPIHRAHYELFTRALDDPLVKKNSVVLVHPTCGPTQPDDIPGIVRYKTYEVLKEQTKNPRVFWSYLPYSMHMAGPREAMQHMIIRKNFGCTHFIIGRDMAGCKSSLDGKPFF